MRELQGDNVLYLNLGESIQVFNGSSSFTPHAYFFASYLSYYTIKQSSKYTHMLTRTRAHTHTSILLRIGHPYCIYPTLEMWHHQSLLPMSRLI